MQWYRKAVYMIGGVTCVVAVCGARCSGFWLLLVTVDLLAILLLNPSAR
jgi:hypothetical protein